jgi:pimeloyl-ACP methyl ester carboxylesterase
VVFLLVVASAGAGCGNSGPSVSAPKVGTGPGGTALRDFPASQDFYKLPASVRPEPPGTLERVQTISDTGGIVTLRVMYHSKDAAGHDALVTGLVTYPTAPAPEGGWPVISWDHGTNGMGPRCAPSRTGGAQSVVSFGVRGVGVATDYQGEGPDGEIAPYLDRATEGESTIDIVRAARQIPDAHASSTWVNVGDSQGGHASLAAAELAPTYAPKLHLAGTVAIAPGAMLAHLYPGDSQIVNDVISTMVLFGAQAADPIINPDQVVAPAMRSMGSVIRSGCVNAIEKAVVGAYVKTGGHVFTTPPLDLPQGQAWVKANDVPQVRVPSPLLVIAGGEDTIVVPARINAMMSRLCALGDRVSVRWYPTATHDTEPTLAAARIGRWIEARLRGTPPPTSCPYSPPASTVIPPSS